MELFLFGYFLPIFVDKMLWDVVCEFNSVFCWFISIPAYNVFTVTVLNDVAEDFVDVVLVRINSVRVGVLI